MYSGKEYIAGLTEEPMQLLECYETEFANDPFLDNNSQLWDTLMGSLGNERRKAWQDLIPNTNMSQNSKKPGNQQNMSIPTKPFTLEELEAGLCTMNLGKAVGPDNILTELITHLLPAAKQWL
ncbi:hypothetical protein F7725_021355, partial [Dissostichus mawsoni]